MNYDKTNELNINPRTTGDYHVTFKSHHTSDNHLCGDNSHWWPLWCEYVLDKTNIPVYISRILLGRSRKSNVKKYIPSTVSSYYTHRPFTFASRSEIIKPNQYITLCHQKFFLTFCCTLSIVSLLISTLAATKTSRKIKY